jgi:hypothetical protein
VPDPATTPPSTNLMTIDELAGGGVGVDELQL